MHAILKPGRDRNDEKHVIHQMMEKHQTCIIDKANEKVEENVSGNLGLIA